MKRQSKRPAAFRANAAVLGGAWLAMTLCNALTPLISDDYTYLLRYPTRQPVASLWDIVLSQAENYRLWSGRCLALGLNQLFLFVGKGWFNPLNAAAFCAVVWLAAKLAVGARPVPPALLLVSLGLLVHANPCFGAVNLWTCGSCVYLWPLLAALALLLPYRLQLDAPLRMAKGAPVWMFVLGVAAGWGNENTSGAAMLGAALLAVALRRTQKKAPAWAVSGALGAAAGFCVLMAAPGQWVRMDTVNANQADSRSLLTVLTVRLMNATHSLRVYGLWLAVALGVLFAVCLVAGAQRRALWLAGGAGLLALAANYAMVLCPVYYVRSFYPVLAFLVVAVLCCLDALGRANLPALRLAAGAAAGALCVLLCFDALEGGYDIASYHTMRRVRDAEIAAQLAQGQEDVVTYAVYPYTRFCGAWGQPDLRLNSDNWVNVNAALYYGARSIAVTEQHYYPFPGWDDFSMTVEREMSLELE